MLYSNVVQQLKCLHEYTDDVLAHTDVKPDEALQIVLICGAVVKEKLLIEEYILMHEHPNMPTNMQDGYLEGYGDQLMHMSVANEIDKRTLPPLYADDMVAQDKIARDFLPDDVYVTRDVDIDNELPF